MSSKKSNSVCILTRQRIEDIAKDKVSKLPHSYFRGMVYDVFYNETTDDICVEVFDADIEQYKECGYEYICYFEARDNGTYMIFPLKTKFKDILESTN